MILEICYKTGLTFFFILIVIGSNIINKLTHDLFTVIGHKLLIS